MFFSNALLDCSGLSVEEPALIKSRSALLIGHFNNPRFGCVTIEVMVLIFSRASAPSCPSLPISNLPTASFHSILARLQISFIIFSADFLCDVVGTKFHSENCANSSSVSPFLLRYFRRFSESVIVEAV